MCRPVELSRRSSFRLRPQTTPFLTKTQSACQAGLRYRRSEDEKSAVEEERIHHIRPWYPTLARAVVDLGADEGQIVGALRVLQKAMLSSELNNGQGIGQR